MQKKHYSFVTKWAIQAPLEEVWKIIYESEKWPEWWHDVKHVKEIVSGDQNGIGSIRLYTLKSPMVYSLSFELMLIKRTDYCLLEGTVSGDLEGTGAWRFSMSDKICYAECHWNVTTSVWWMNLLAFLLMPVFRYNHGLVMRRGARNLANKLNATLVYY